MNKKLISIVLSTIMTLSGGQVKKDNKSESKLYNEDEFVSEFSVSDEEVKGSNKERGLMDLIVKAVNVVLEDNSLTVGDYMILKNIIESEYAKTTDVNKYAYVSSESTTLSNVCEDYIGDVKLDKFQKVYVLYETNGYSYALCENGRYGFIKKSDLTTLEDEYIEVDISDQKLYYYVNNELVVETPIITGYDNKHDTRLGSFQIYEKTKGRYLAGEDYRVWVDYWMRFDKGIGLHDASWRKGVFGGEIYKKNGSHGCVNMPSDKAAYVYENAKMKTRVLVHK
mgnify:CR=1 FL=1